MGKDNDLLNDLLVELTSLTSRIAAEVEREQLRELVKRFAGMIDAERAALEVKPNLSVREWDKVRVRLQQATYEIDCLNCPALDFCDAHKGQGCLESLIGWVATQVRVDDEDPEPWEASGGTPSQD